MTAHPDNTKLRVSTRLTQLGLGLARQHLDLLPDVELVLKRPDMPHLGARVAVDHQRAFPSP